MNTITVACGQFDIKIGNKPYNIAKMEEMSRHAKRKSADLIVFPECSACGFAFDSPDEAREIAEPVPGPFTAKMTALASELNMSIVFGLIESDGGSLYNTAALCDPDGNMATYRKTHLPFLGVDRFLDKGTEIRTVGTRFGPAGLMICYDLRFPEAARQLALGGARILILPTNLPEGAEVLPEVLTRTRAVENKVFFVSCNRCGVERGKRFFGRSQIIDMTGDVLAELEDEEGLIYATLDLSKAEEKDRIVIPGEYETYLFRDRRPELYGGLTET